MAENVGPVTISLNGQVIAQCKSVRTDVNTGRRVQKGMNPTGRPDGFTQGTPKYTLDVDVYIRKIGGAVDWDNLQNAVLTICPRGISGKMIIYTEVICLSYSEAYGEEEEAVRAVKLEALNRIEVDI